MRHEIIGVHPVPAGEPGSLAGFGAECSCGTVIESSLDVIARQWGRQHCDYYNKKEGHHA